MRREDAVVEHEVDARARDQGGELFEELQGLEDQVAGAVGPWGLEREPDAAVDDPHVIRQILAHLGLPIEVPRPDPPQPPPDEPASFLADVFASIEP